MASRQRDERINKVYIYQELPAAASVMQSSSKELSTLVADRVLKKM